MLHIRNLHVQDYNPINLPHSCHKQEKSLKKSLRFSPPGGQIWSLTGTLYLLETFGKKVYTFCQNLRKFRWLVSKILRKEMYFFCIFIMPSYSNAHIFDLEWIMPHYKFILPNTSVMFSHSCCNSLGEDVSQMTFC